MHTEIEAKFLNTDHDIMRARLVKMGAECVHEKRAMRRKNYDFTDDSLGTEKNAWVRVRDEGDKITLSYKQLDDRGLHGTKEINVTIDSFERADELLAAMGMKSTSYQETKRESWRLGSVEIELDEWPWIKPFLEIEAGSEDEVRECAARLGLDWSMAVHGSVEIAYQAEYDVTDDEVDNLPTITFAAEPPEWFAARRKER